MTYTLAAGTQREGQTPAQPLPTLRICMEASAQACTPVNMVQHTHWNLSGSQRVSQVTYMHTRNCFDAIPYQKMHQIRCWPLLQGQTVGAHELRLIGASHYTPVDDTLIPTGEVVAVAGTPLDFTQSPMRLDPRLRELADGIDHNFVIAAEASGAHGGSGSGGGGAAMEAGGMRPVEQGTVPVAELRDPESGRGLELSSNAPGLQVYTGNFLEGAPGKAGVVYCQHQSICLESQTFPNSVNVAAFPSPFIRPEEVYRHRMDVRFLTFGLEEEGV